ncbi:MAG: glycosyltransferase family 2 protein [Gammaproteobacteria bacterium]|jgi:abequosyltransferase|nr:glycosyltransferase family 2 protein [Gammaproteobacteria bacterium]
MADPKLSICIATFNRAGFIGQTLESILSQVTDEVEIVILDGGSTDDTAARVGRYVSASHQLRYLRQDTNRGVDRDFNTAVEAARGEYCWLMSDDDLLKPGAIRAVLDALSGSYSLVLVNAEVRNFDFSRQLEDRRLSFDSNRNYAPAEMDRLFVETGGYMTFIGCVVIRRAVWLERQKEPYYGSLFIHVGVIFQERLPGPALALAQPLICIRYGNAMWKPKEFEIWMFKWPGLIWSLAGLSDAARNSNCRAEPWRIPKTLLYYRAKGTYSITEYHRWVAPRVRSSWDGFTARAIARVPGVVANLLGLLYYSARGPKWRMAVADMRQSRFYYRNLFAASS